MKLVSYNSSSRRRSGRILTPTRLYQASWAPCYPRRFSTRPRKKNPVKLHNFGDSESRYCAVCDGLINHELDREYLKIVIILEK